MTGQAPGAQVTAQGGGAYDGGKADPCRFIDACRDPPEVRALVEDAFD